MKKPLLSHQLLCSAFPSLLLPLKNVTWRGTQGHLGRCRPLTLATFNRFWNFFVHPSVLKKQKNGTWGYKDREQKYKLISSMLKNEGLFVFCANVFRLKQIWLWKKSGRCCCHGAFGFPGRAGGALGPETKPRGTTANLSALPHFLPASHQSSLSFKLQGSHTACLGVEFILNKCFAWLAILKKKKKASH